MTLRRLLPVGLVLLVAAGPSLAGPTDSDVAGAAWEAARAGNREVAPLLVESLEAAALRPEGERSWALEEVLLDSLATLGAPVPGGALLSCLGDHVDVVVLLLARGGEASVPALRTAYERLDPGRRNEAWWTAGAALAAFDADAFRRRLLAEVRIERTVAATSSGLPRPAARHRHRREPSSARPPPTFETWREVKEVPEGFPPVGVWRLRLAEGPGRDPVRPRIDAWAERMEENVGGGVPRREVVLEGTTEDDLSPAQARLDWLQQPVLGEAGVVPLRASDEVHLLYAGPTPWREFVLPLQRSLHVGWWGTVSALVRTGRLTAEEAGALEAPIVLHTGGLPLPPSGVPNPFAVRRPPRPGGL